MQFGVFFLRVGLVVPITSQTRLSLLMPDNKITQVAQESKQAARDNKPIKHEMKSERTVASELLRKRIEEIKKFDTAKQQQQQAAVSELEIETNENKPMMSPMMMKTTQQLNNASSSSSDLLSNLLSSGDDGLRSYKRKQCETETKSSLDDDPQTKKAKMIDDLLKIKSTHHKNVFDSEKNPHYKVKTKNNH